MRIAQIVLPEASQYERKSQRADHALLVEKHEVRVLPLENVTAGVADVAHVYGPVVLDPKRFRHFPLPYVSNGVMEKSRWSLRKPREPEFVISPLGDKPVPEAVEDVYFAASGAAAASAAERETRRPERPPLHKTLHTIGSYRRADTLDFIARTVARIERFRGDVAWNLYDHPPTPADLAAVDVWVDPAVSANDYDGFVAEALVVGRPAVASRTPINDLRLERGRTGFLVPVNDANEMTHAILAALFKPEVADSRLQASRQTISKYRARQRFRILVHMYESSIP